MRLSVADTRGRADAGHDRGAAGHPDGPVGVHFSLLGPLRVNREGTELPVRGRKPRMLLVALLLDAGQPTG